MILTIFTFIVILSILVFIHEFGHFFVAKKLGIGVEEFGFGLPPRIWGKKIGETIYSINWLPIGGFVKLTGEDDVQAQSAKVSVQGRSAFGGKVQSEKYKKYFWARSKKERTAVLLAGVFMNFTLAVIIISYIFTQGVFVPTNRVHIEKVADNTPAAMANLQKGDVITAIDDVTITTSEALIAAINEKKGKETTLIVKRGSETVTVVVAPRTEYPPDQGALGIAISNLEEKKYSWYQAPIMGLIEALKMSVMLLSTLGIMLWRLITFQGLAGFDVAGPIGIVQVTGQAVKSGFMSVLEMMGLLSLNLAILNVLPIPALDGGRLLFVVLEKFIGHKVKPRIEQAAHQIGMLFLFALIALVTANDIYKLIRH